MKNQPLIDARLAAGLTQREIANKANITVSGYQYYEMGMREPRVTTAMVISDILNVPIHELFENVAKDKHTTAGPPKKRTER